MARRRRSRRAPRLLRRLLRRPRLALLVAAGLALAPLVLLNVSVAFFGRTTVFPLSPRHLGNKAEALKLYARHRVSCLLETHEDTRPVVARVARRHGLDEALLAALVEVESGGQPHRIPPAGAMGPAQLIPSTARLLGVHDPYDPEEGIDGGARYLARLLRRFKDERLALAAYNAGPGAVRGRRVPRNGETEHYVERVMARAARERAGRAVKPASVR